MTTTTLTHHVEVNEGTDTSFRLFYINSSTGFPFDLTGYSAQMQVRCEYSGVDNPDAVLRFTSNPNEGIVIGGTAGTIDVYISYEDTSNQTWTRGNYDLFLISPTGARTRFVKGFFTIIPSSTTPLI